MVLLTAPSHVDVFFECQMLNVKLTDVYYSHHLPNIQKFFGHIPFIDIETINTLIHSLKVLRKLSTVNVEKIYSTLMLSQ